MLTLKVDLKGFFRGAAFVFPSYLAVEEVNLDDTQVESEV